MHRRRRTSHFRLLTTKISQRVERHRLESWLTFVVFAVPIAWWLLGGECSISIQWVAFLSNAFAIWFALERGKYTTMMWLGLTLANCASVLAHDALDISFLSSGELFYSETFESVRWATVISSSISSAIGTILPPIFAPGVLEKTTRSRSLTITPLGASLCAILATGLFCVVQINHPFLFSEGYAGETRAVVPSGILTVCGAAAALSFLVAATAIFGKKVYCGCWPMPATAIFAVAISLTFGGLLLKGERGIPLYITLIFLLLWHANRNSIDATARVTGFPGFCRMISPEKPRPFTLGRAVSPRRTKRSVLVAVGGVILIPLLMVFARVRSIEGGIVSIAAWEGAFASLFGYGEVEVQAVMVPLSSMYHMVVCVSFWEDNFRLYGQSYMNLVYQQIPLVLEGIMRISRPLSDPERLSQLLPDQPGGIYVLGQAYWNFGMSGIIGFTLLMVPALWSLERWLVRRSFGGAVVAMSLAASMPKFMLYGIQWGIRNLTMLLVFAVVIDRLVFRADHKGRGGKSNCATSHNGPGVAARV
jgi:hypothetical protein